MILGIRPYATHRSDWHQSIMVSKTIVSTLTIMTFAFNVNNQLHNSFKFSQEKYQTLGYSYRASLEASDSATVQE